jgi:hypothetical protein
MMLICECHLNELERSQIIQGLPERHLER